MCVDLKNKKVFKENHSFHKVFIISNENKKKIQFLQKKLRGDYLFFVVVFCTPIYSIYTRIIQFIVFPCFLGTEFIKRVYCSTLSQDLSGVYFKDVWVV